MERLNISGINFCNTTLPEASQIIYQRAKDNIKTTVVTPNAEIAVICKENAQAQTAVNQADVILPDGVGVILASKILKTPLKSRVTGVDMAYELLKRLNEDYGKLFLYGAREDRVQKAVENIKNDYPNITVNAINGYIDEQQAVSTLNKNDFQVCFVCLGAPKQELFMSKYRQQLPAAVYLGLGGVIDVLSGEVNRAPKFFIDMNLEWFYRIVTHPSRLKRAVKIPKYLYLVAKERRGKK